MDYMRSSHVHVPDMPCKFIQLFDFNFGDGMYILITLAVVIGPDRLSVPISV